MSAQRETRVASHRNGTAGEGFHVVLFDHPETGRRMVGVLFSGEGQSAFLDVAMLARDEIRFGVNSWRCEDFEPEAEQAISTYELLRSVGLPA